MDASGRSKQRVGEGMQAVPLCGQRRRAARTEGLRAVLQPGHIHPKHPGAAAKRTRFSDLNCEGDKESAPIHN